MTKFIRGIAVWSLFLSTISFTAGAETPALANEPSACNAVGVILGTQGFDSLIGTEGDDVFCALDGDDAINGLGGNDVVYGGQGNDVILGGAGKDDIHGGGGDDTISGDQGDDEIFGDEGQDQLFGNDGADNLSGGAESDNLYGGSGNDGLRGDAGDDRLSGDTGVNSCVKDLSDIVTGCFYDSKGPVMTGFTLAPGGSTLRAQAPNARVQFRVAVVDPGAGLNYMTVSFSTAKAIYDGMSGGGLSLEMPNNFQTCDYFSLNPRASGYCLFSGNDNRGVYEGYIVPPLNAAKQTFYLDHLEFRDKARNSSTTGYYQRVKKGPKASIKQLDVPDAQAPTIEILNLVNDDNVQSGPEDYVELRVRLTDKTGFKSLAFEQENFAGGGLYGEVSFDYAYPCDLVGRPIQYGCKEGTDPKNVVMRVPLYYSAAGLSIFDVIYGPKKFQFDQVTLRDSLNNRKVLAIKPTTAAGQKILLKKTFVIPRTTDDGDRSAPIISKVILSPSRINTGTKPQTIRVAVTVSDSGVGFNELDPDVWLIMGNRIEGSAEVECTKAGFTGGKSYAIVKFDCLFPAHYPGSKIYITELSAMDLSQRNNYTSYALTEGGLSANAKKILGLYVKNG
jgi:hypothetical protein